jgi:hypothetical protein
MAAPAPTVTSVQHAFEAFEAGVVRIPPSEDEAAQAVHPELRNSIKKALGAILLDDFLSGSFSRRVQVAPRLKDIDVVLTLTDPTGAFRRSATAALVVIQAAAKTCDLVRDAEIRCRSVRAYLHDYDFTVDLVASLPCESTGLMLARRIPEEGLDDWTWGDPKRQRQVAFEKNEVCARMYIPEVRLVKFWKNGATELFKSYHAESILFHALKRPMEYANATGLFFDEAYARLAPGAFTEDPGAPGVYVDERLDAYERQAARRAVEIARRDAYAALTADSLEEALNAWARVFGPSFPAPDSSSESLARSIAAGTAGITSLGLTANRGTRPIRPRSWREAD